MRTISNPLILILFFCLSFPLLCSAEGKKANFIFYDQIVKPGEKAYLKAILKKAGLFVKFEIGGERIEFFEKSKGRKKSFGIALTGGDGTAVKEVPPLRTGIHHFTAKLADEIRYTAEESEGIIACLDQKTPIIVVDIATFSETEKIDFLFQRIEKEPKPKKEATQVIKRLSRNYNIIYLTNKDDTALSKTRLWLKENQFPTAPIFSVMADEESLSEEYSERIKEWKKVGWNIKIGIGNSSKHAEAYLDNGMKALIIEDEEELPEKAITVKGWKEIERVILRPTSKDNSKNK